MGLIAWFPFNNSIDNFGTGTYNLTARPSFTSNGKTAKYCAVHSGTGGANSYITSQRFSRSNTDPISIFCWVYMDSYANEGANLTGIVSNHDHSQNGDRGAGFGLNLRNTGSSLQVTCSTPYGTTIGGRSYSQVHGATTFSIGSWHHIGMVYDGVCIRLYLDGVKQTICFDGSNTGLDYYSFTATPASNNPIGIFCWSTSYTGYSGNMKVQDARVYDCVVSDLEVKNLAKALVLHYNFEDLYTPLDYIASSGTQYIDTGIKPSGSSLRVVMDYKFNVSSGDQTLFGTTTEGKMCLNAMVSNNKTWQFGSNNWRNYANQPSCDMNRHIVDCYWGNGSQYFKVDNTTIYSGSEGQITDSSNFRLFNHYNRYYRTQKAK